MNAKPLLIFALLYIGACSSTNAPPKPPFVTVHKDGTCDVVDTNFGGETLHLHAKVCLPGDNNSTTIGLECGTLVCSTGTMLGTQCNFPAAPQVPGLCPLQHAGYGGWTIVKD